MKKVVSLFGVFAAMTLLAGCFGCCGDKKSSIKKEESHKVMKKDDKKHMSKKDSKKPVKKESEYRKVKKEADSLVKDL